MCSKDPPLYSNNCKFADFYVDYWMTKILSLLFFLLSLLHTIRLFLRLSLLFFRSCSLISSTGIHLRLLATHVHASPRKLSAYRVILPTYDGPPLGPEQKPPKTIKLRRETYHTSPSILHTPRHVKRTQLRRYDCFPSRETVTQRGMRYRREHSPRIPSKSLENLKKTYKTSVTRRGGKEERWRMLDEKGAFVNRSSSPPFPSSNLFSRFPFHP